MVSPSIVNEPLVLCCAQKGRWCPLSVDRSSTVGAFFVAEGHSLKMKTDYTDLFTINVSNSVSGDPTQIFFTSADRGHYLLCVNNMLCERARVAGIGGPWEKLELRPALAGNYYCFHLYASSGSGLSSNLVPVCFDEAGACLVQCAPAPECERAVFALQYASAAVLLKEIQDLERKGSEQRYMFNSLDDLVKKTGEDSADFQNLSRSRDEEEEKLVFLQDNFAFYTQQLQYELLRADHASPPQAGIPDSADSLSSSSGSTVQSGSSCSRSMTKSDRS